MSLLVVHGVAAAAVPGRVRSLDLAADAARLAALLHAAFHDDPREATAAAANVRLLQRLAPLVRGLERAGLVPPRVPEGCVWEIGGEVAGAALLRALRSPDGVWLLEYLAVPPEWQRRGIGGALLAAAIERAMAAGARWLVLEVAASNRSARRLYAAAGFRAYDRVAGFSLPSWPDGANVRGGARIHTAAAASLEATTRWPPDVQARAARSSDWQARWALAAAATPRNVAAIIPPRPEAFRIRTGQYLLRAALDWWRGRTRRLWLAEADGHVVAEVEVVSACGTPWRGRAQTDQHVVRFVIHPGWEGGVEAPLLDFALSAVPRARRVPVAATVRPTEAALAAALHARGFRLREVRDRLALRLAPPAGAP